jgi:toxin ParE1/3/4
LAEQDLTSAARHFAKEGGAALGARVFDAAIASLEPSQRMPGMGSPRLGELCDIPGLRSWGVTGFQLRLFYFERPDHLDIVRLLDERQDIAAILRGDV